MNGQLNVSDFDKKKEAAQEEINKIGLIGDIGYKYSKEADIFLDGNQKFQLNLEMFFKHFENHPEMASADAKEQVYGRLELFGFWNGYDAKQYEVDFIINEMYLDLTESGPKIFEFGSSEWFEYNCELYCKRGYSKEAEEILIKKSFLQEEAKNQLWSLFIGEMSKGSAQKKRIELLLKKKLLEIFDELNLPIKE